MTWNTIRNDDAPKTLATNRLTSEEIQYYRKNGLCFHSADKYILGHSCDKKQLMLIDVYDSMNKLLIMAKTILNLKLQLVQFIGLLYLYQFKP